MDVLAKDRRAFVSVQERALAAEAAALRRADPTLRLKDYRVRSLQTLHGAITIRIPRLT